MPRQQTSSTGVGPHDVQKPPLPSKPSPPGADHQPRIRQNVEVQAKKLVDQAGSADDAKRAVDSVAGREPASDFRQDHFARRWGFASRKELVAASSPLESEDGTAWWATPVRGDRWIVWNEDSMSADTSYGSLDEAAKSLLKRHNENGKPKESSGQGTEEFID